MRPIASNTDDTLTLAGGDAWTTVPDSTSRYVAVKPGHDLIAISRDRVFWLEETTTLLGFARLERAENILDIRRAVRLMPNTHNFLAADNKPFNDIGTNLGPGTGNTGEDRDGDGVKNSVDNRPLVANPDQKDANGNRIGDAC
ncbi:MAG: thrombospondin type 3 repeat-containing protein [Dehalococcoidia bacterium]|nr:thrombospondin type 3 repeat-containing protein [Dehalococcoidia bacterium]